MAKKIKKFSSDIAVPRRNSEKFRRAGRLFDRAIIAYVLLVILSAITGSHGHYELQNAADNGFAVCFLLLPAILPLMLAGGIGTMIVAWLKEGMKAPREEFVTEIEKMVYAVFVR